MLRRCSRCKNLLRVSEFNWKIKDVKLSYHCKACSRKYIKNHYNNNRQYYLKKAQKRNLAIRGVLREYVGNYLSCHPCVDCGERDILVLEFDHKDKTSKEFYVSRIIRVAGALDKLEEEIMKCDVRCANCHRRKTALEINSWKLTWAPVA